MKNKNRINQFNGQSASACVHPPPTTSVAWCSAAAATSGPQAKPAHQRTLAFRQRSAVGGFGKTPYAGLSRIQRREVGGKTKKRVIWHFVFEIWKMSSNIWNARLKLAIWLVSKLKFENLNLKIELWNMNFEIWNAKCFMPHAEWEMANATCDIWDLKCVMWDLKCEIWHLTCDSRGMWRGRAHCTPTGEQIHDHSHKRKPNCHNQQQGNPYNPNEAHALKHGRSTQ